MRQEISVSTVFANCSTDQSSIGTHSGIFHMDDLIAVALHCIANEKRPIYVVRSRDMEELTKCDIVVDVGGGMYDHHQVGGNGARKNSVPFASAGLYWKFNGRNIIRALSAKHFGSSLSEQDINYIHQSLDDNLFQEIDKGDNGIVARSTVFDFVSSFLPNWRDVDKSATIYEDCFKEALEVTIPILYKQILHKIDKVISYNYVVYTFKNHPEDRIMQIPAQSFPWIAPVITINADFQGHIDFVVFKYPSGGWAAQCVPPSYTARFEQRVPFPESWAGHKDDLPEISGIPDAIFCHNGRFFARAESYESIIKMCHIAMEEAV